MTQNHKLTPKQDNFCRKYIETGNASEAYRTSYDAGKMKSTTINRNAFALLDDSKIAARIETLQSKHREKHDITVDFLTKMHKNAYALAANGKEAKIKIVDGKVVTLINGVAPSASAATQATQNIAKLHGLIIDKKASTDTAGNDKIEKLEVEYTFIDADAKD